MPVDPSVRSAEINSQLAELRRQMKRRIEQLEHEQVVKLLATFQEFHARAAAIRRGHA